jgi:hypothetical protein
MGTADERKRRADWGDARYSADPGNDAGCEPEIDETEFEDLAAFRLTPEAIPGESESFLRRYAAYLQKHGFNFD